MTREEEKLRAKDDNAQLALEFTKEFNECIKIQIPKESAVLAVLHDLADWKDKHPRKGLWDSEKVIEWLNAVDLSKYWDLGLINWGAFIDDLCKAMEER